METRKNDLETNVRKYTRSDLFSNSMGTDIHIFFEKYDENERQWFAMRIQYHDIPDEVLRKFPRKFPFSQNIEILTDYELDLLVKSKEEDVSGCFPGWEDIGLEFDTNRGYNLFGLLAGVRRTDITPLVQPRGFPDSSAFYRNRFFNAYILEDMHHHTYFTLTELINANTEENRGQYSYDRMTTIIQPLVDCCHQNDINTEHIRAVICFDS